MPNDVGLRQCVCGQFFLRQQMVQVGQVAREEAAHLRPLYTVTVPDALLPHCIATASSERVEVAARLNYWRSLNHPYRARYRDHRAAEEAATQAAWQATHPPADTDASPADKPQVYNRPPNSPVTCPAFEPTEEQIRNMERLADIFLEQHHASGGRYALDLAELYRELGRFEEAAHMLATLSEEDQQDASVQLMGRLLREQQTAPMRYGMPTLVVIG